MFFTSQQIQLPHDIIVYLSNFLRFEDFRNFLRALSPNGNEHEFLQPEHLWRLSTHKFTATFLNGKSLEIEYNFDPERTREKWVLVKVESLSPVIGEVVSPDQGYFRKFIQHAELFGYIRQFQQVFPWQTRLLLLCHAGRTREYGN